MNLEQFHDCNSSKAYNCLCFDYIRMVHAELVIEFLLPVKWLIFGLCFEYRDPSLHIHSSLSKVTQIKFLA